MGIKEKITAKQARVASRALRMNLAEFLLDPEFDASNPLLPDTADDDPNQLHKDHQGKALKLWVPVFEQGSDGRSGTITLYWDGTAIGVPYTFTTPITTFPVSIDLAASATQNEGSFKLHYVVAIRSTTSRSEPMVVNVDQTPPNGNNRGAVVTLPPEVEANGITRAYLDANGGKVKVTVPNSYTDAKIGDVVEVWYGISIPLATLVGRVDRTDINAPIEFELTEAMLGEEGPKSLFYKLADRKGNIGPDSAYKTVNVELTSPPDNLLPPTVPLAADDLIDYADAVEGVRVVIGPYDNWFSRDQVVITFDGTDHAPQQMPQNGANILLPYSLVYGGDLGEKDSRVTYRIMRGSNPFPELTGVDFKVDLRTPGPDPTDPPEEVHPGLNIVVVKGSTSPDDQLGEADRASPVNATALIYADPEAGEYAQLYWNGELVPGARYDVTGSEDATFQIPFTVPWSTIDAVGNGDIPVHYVVGHALNDNVLSSGTKNVKVEGVPIVLPTPAFMHLYFDDSVPDGLLGCSSLQVKDGALVAEIEVPGGDDRLADKELTFVYQGWSDSGGVNPIDDTDDTFTYTPSAEEAKDGFTVQLPYETALKETKLAFGSIHYTVEVEGKPVGSPRHLVETELWRPGDFYCEIPARRAR